MKTDEEALQELFRSSGYAPDGTLLNDSRPVPTEQAGQSPADAHVPVETPTPSAAASDYRFPFNDPEVVKVLTEVGRDSPQKLLERLRGLFYADGVALNRPYMDIRAEVCAVLLRLNQLERAPRVRPIRKHKIAAGIKMTRDESDFSNDLQVLDLDWLARDVQRRVFFSEKASRMFTETGLDFDKASRFVRTRGKTSDKAVELGLSELDELMLAVIQTRETAARWRTICEGRDVARLKLSNYTSMAVSRLDKLRIGDRLEEYTALRLARGQLKIASTMLAAFYGRSVSPSILGRRRQLFVKAGISAD